MRSYARGTKAVLPEKLAREVCEAHFCSFHVSVKSAAGRFCGSLTDI